MRVARMIIDGGLAPGGELVEIAVPDEVTIDHELARNCLQASVIRGRASLRLSPSSIPRAVEFRHKSWWNEEVNAAFRKAGIIFCSCSGPQLPDQLIRTAEEIYLRLHGPLRWYRHNYSDEELAL